MRSFKSVAPPFASRATEFLLYLCPRLTPTRMRIEKATVTLTSFKVNAGRTVEATSKRAPTADP